ncbi:MAG: hypothetical protein JWP34_2846 [Massilia sp.]|nr:hypothetical protein [Massilia sp.]MDB5908732.1 hypothetical protein [Massilia sp.]
MLGGPLCKMLHNREIEFRGLGAPVYPMGQTR